MVGFVSQLRSVIAEATAFDPDLLSPAELAGEIGEILYSIQMLDVTAAVLVKHLGDRGGHRELGYSSPTALLTDVGRMSPGHARSLVSMGLAADRAPVAHQAWTDGRLSTDQAKHLFAAAENLPDLYPQAEAGLVEIVEGLDAVDTGRAVEYWRQAVDGPGELDPETQWIRRGLTCSKTIGGMRRVDAWLTTTCAQAFEASLAAHMPPPGENDHRTPRQRRHDALEALCRNLLDNGTTASIGGEKPHISVHCDLQALQGIGGGLHETENREIIDVDTLRMIACDSSITRIIIGPESEILDVGRKTRVWTTAQRRAIIARDRHCQGRGCHTPARYCDIHHIHHWADGGETTISKGKLYCRPCHTLEHQKDRNHRRRRKG